MGHFNSSAAVVLLVDLALKSAAILLVAWLSASLLFRASAAWRHLVWTLGVLGLLALPIVSLSLPGWGVPLLPTWLVASDLANSALAETSPLPSAHGRETLVPRPLPAVPLAGQEVAVESTAMTRVPIVRPASAEQLTPPTPATNSPRASGFRAIPWQAVLAAVWIAGSLLALVPFGRALWQLRRLETHSSAVKDSRRLALLDRLRADLHLRRTVRLLQNNQSRVPITWGAFRPVLLVPAEADDWSDDRWRLVLLHELAHIRRWDWLTQLVAHATCTVYWFNPLAWLAAQRMRIEREQACDDLVLAQGAKASLYAHELLQLAAGLGEPPFSPLVAVPMARHSGLEDRLRGILDARRSRAALTTAAVGLTTLLAAATIGPLAMLRAAPGSDPESAPAAEKPAGAQPASDKPPADKPKADAPAQRDPTLEEIEARKSGIRISVLNAKGDRGIPEFRVIAGVKAGSVAADYEKRTGREVVNWQPHTLRIGKEGDYTWPLAKAYDEMAIRIEADGYQPQIFAWIKKADGVQHIVFMLAEDKGVAGRVLKPGGAPAAGATISLALPSQENVWENGQLRHEGEPPAEKPSDQWRRPRFFSADAEGRFTLPSEFEPAALLVIHESGVRELAYDEWKKSPEVRLDKWGRIEGQVLWQDKPGTDRDVTLSVHRHDYGYPGMVASYGRTRTDAEGRFVFDRVLPGLTQISHPIRPNPADISGPNEVILEGMFQHAKVAAGEPTRVVLGGQGRTVNGKLVGLDAWEGVTFHVHPNAPHIGFPGDDSSWQAFAQLQQSTVTGPIFFRNKQPVGKDGSFSVERMLPGTYQLFVSVPGSKNYAGSTRFTVPVEQPGAVPEPLKLDDIQVKQPAADPAPDAPPGDKPMVDKIPEDRATEVGATEEETPEDKAPAAAEQPKSVTVHLKVVDEATGKPITRLILQAGRFEPDQLDKATWGYSERTDSSSEGLYDYTLMWASGWTGRVLADGYLPQPMLDKAPPAGADKLDVTLRLKRGRTVRGKVLDHRGEPVAGAAVFAVGPTSLNLAAGKSWNSLGDEDTAVLRGTTNDAGQFEVAAGGAERVAVSYTGLALWPAMIPDEGDLTIRLPEPARVEVELDIDGAFGESKVFYQFLTHLDKEFANLQSSREFTMKNPGQLSLAGLTPGRYQICRQVMNHLGEIGIGAMLDREFFEIAPGETKTIRFVREKGARLKGRVTWPEGVTLMGTVVSVRSKESKKGPFDDFDWETEYSSQVALGDGSFITERIPPGKQRITAEAYIPLTPEQRFRTGIIGPTYRAEVEVDVPESGELAVPNLELAVPKRE
jgi:beta-lactamase regulating signal transducer with metallopeptidase domain